MHYLRLMDDDVVFLGVEEEKKTASWVTRQRERERLKSPSHPTDKIRRVLEVTNTRACPTNFLIDSMASRIFMKKESVSEQSALQKSSLVVLQITYRSII